MAITWQSARLTGCALIAALAAAGCTSGHHGGTTASHPARTTTTPPTTATVGASPDPHAPSVAKAPEIASDGITALASGTQVKGDAVYEIPGGIKAGQTLAIAIDCEGPGRLTVEVQPTSLSFPLLREKGKVLSTMNEIHMSRSRSSGSLRFTSEPDVTWSFAVGWDPNPPQQQEPSTQL
ncbi:hypothetical protein [Streptomyces sp. Ru72]|uniref:hypothetical protein n=1 Tax=Streptomyces sp. Ru72 TaxID=2080747 RepID=UPI000CDE3ACE|nr:hypothetical protein [Streptomyces sp. Ru72]POX54854.1 hypothetical protein C3488_00135 [Streptomyces sp. Ru72]